jgi:hypothetical protein
MLALMSECVTYEGRVIQLYQVWRAEAGDPNTLDYMTIEEQTKEMALERIQARIRHQEKRRARILRVNLEEV